MDEKKLTIYFTSDLHGYIYPTDYRSREERDIGLFKCASQFRKDGNTLVVDGGDLLQGSPLGAYCHDTIGSTRRQNVEGQLDMFGMASVSGGEDANKIQLPDIPEYSATERMHMEKETTGLYLSGHPMTDRRPLARRLGAAAAPQAAGAASPLSGRSAPAGRCCRT